MVLLIVGLQDHRRALNVVLEPPDGLLVPHQLNGFLFLPADCSVHVIGPVQRGVGGLKPVGETVPGPQDGVYAAGGDQQRRQHYGGAAQDGHAPQFEDSPVPKVPQGKGPGHGEEHPGLEVELELGVHPADVVLHPYELHGYAYEQGQGGECQGRRQVRNVLLSPGEDHFPSHQGQGQEHSQEGRRPVPRRPQIYDGHTVQASPKESPVGPPLNSREADSREADPPRGRQRGRPRSWPATASPGKLS